MLPIQTVLHPTDFSERSDYAFRLACALARDYGARVIVLHVWSPPAAVFGDVASVPPLPAGYYPAATEEKLSRIQSPDPAVRVVHRLEEGEPVATILAVAEGAKADLIVLGTHGRSGLSRLLMGSVAEGVVRKATCPVVTVKTPFPEAKPVARAEASAAVSEPLLEPMQG
jgi:nucleotide-binding universal stress UspA family protein